MALKLILLNLFFSICSIDNIEYNLKTFSIVKKYYSIEKNCSDCVIFIDEFNKTIEKINLFLKFNPSINASSFIIKKENNLNYHLTSNHVCESLYDNKKEKEETDMIEDIINKSFKFYSIYRKNLTIKSNYILEDINHNEHIIVEVIKKSKEKDLCLITTESSWGNIVEKSDSSPVLGDELYNISGISGIRSKEGFVIFKGIYSGFLDENYFLSSIFAKPGSSGSPVFNMKGKLVGVIHMTYKSLNNLSISSNLKTIIEFIK